MTQIQQHFGLVTYDNYINLLLPMYDYTTPLVPTCFSLTPMQCREYTIPINNVTQSFSLFRQHMHNSILSTFTVIID